LNYVRLNLTGNARPFKQVKSLNSSRASELVETKPSKTKNRQTTLDPHSNSKVENKRKQSK